MPQARRLSTSAAAKTETCVLIFCTHIGQKLVAQIGYIGRENDQLLPYVA